MSDAPKLKPCPFCGGKAHMAKDHDPDGTGAFHFIKCSKCRAKSAELYASETCPVFFAQVRDHWNTRADTLTALQEENARLLEALDGVEDVLSEQANSAAASGNMSVAVILHDAWLLIKSRAALNHTEKEEG